MDNTRGLRTVGFCAGYGGLEIGLEGAGVNITPVAFSEIEAYPASILLARMQEGSIPKTPIWSDLRTFPMEDFHGKVDLLTGGFPCQPFSSAGKQACDEDPRHLFPFFKKFAETVRPQYLFLENVDGIASTSLKGMGWGDPEGTPVLLHVCRELERVGYSVATGCFTAEEMGAPHKRIRWFIYGELGKPEKLQCDGFASYMRSELEQQAHELGDSDRIDDSEGHRFWPAGPDRPQYPGEEPRTMANTGHDGQYESTPNSGSDQTSDGSTEGEEESINSKREGESDNVQSIPGNFEDRENDSEGDTESSTESKLDRTDYGLARRLDEYPQGMDRMNNRVERLKACGNGVVPPTATRAWVTLRYILRSGLAAHYPYIEE